MTAAGARVLGLTPVASGNSSSLSRCSLCGRQVHHQVLEYLPGPRELERLSDTEGPASEWPSPRLDSTSVVSATRLARQVEKVRVVASHPESSTEPCFACHACLRRVRLRRRSRGLMACPCLLLLEIVALLPARHPRISCRNGASRCPPSSSQHSGSPTRC